MEALHPDLCAGLSVCLKIGYLRVSPVPKDDYHFPSAIAIWGYTLFSDTPFLVVLQYVLLGSAAAKSMVKYGKIIMTDSYEGHFVTD